MLPNTSSHKSKDDREPDARSSYDHSTKMFRHFPFQLAESVAIFAISFLNWPIFASSRQLDKSKPSLANGQHCRFQKFAKPPSPVRPIRKDQRRFERSLKSPEGSSRCKWPLKSVRRRMPKVSGGVMSDRPLGVMQVWPVIKCNEILLCHSTLHSMTWFCVVRNPLDCVVCTLACCGVAYGEVNWCYDGVRCYGGRALLWASATV